MGHDLFKSVSQGSDRAQDEENRRIEEIANELERLCQVHEAQFGDGKANVNRNEIEFRLAEQFAKDNGCWIPIMQVFDLGIPGPSGNENDTYVSDEFIYKVNNLMNSGNIVSLFRRIMMQRSAFTNSNTHPSPYSPAYSFSNGS